MSLFQRGDIWWYEFWFAGRRIRESSKSESKTVAKSAEKNRRRELEEGLNNVSDVRRERVRAMGEIADEFFGIANGLKPDRFGWLTPVKVDAAVPVHA